MNIRAKRIMIIFDNGCNDSWEATCQSGIRFDDAMSMIARAWKEYDKPDEPLIKDEKIRKAVRAWAEASYLGGAIFDFDDGTMTLRGEKLTGMLCGRRASISFDGLDFCEFKHITAEYHTITELCGEEEG